MGVAGSRLTPGGESSRHFESSERSAVFDTAYWTVTLVEPAGTVPHTRTGTSKGSTRLKVPAFRLTATSANPVSPVGGAHGSWAAAGPAPKAAARRRAPP